MKEFKDISGPDMAEWCEYLADDNAIHLSKEAAEKAGFGPHRVNPGPANLAYILSCLSAEAEAGLTEIDARFLDNVLEGDWLRAGIKDGAGLLERDGTLVVSADITIKP